MKIENVDFFYLSMPAITLTADGSQDALIVRVCAGGHIGWGECEAAPLPSIAAFVCPTSHGVCQPVAASVLGQKLDSPLDITRIAMLVEHNSMDLLQAAHTWSGIEMALWDLLGKARDEPVWRLLGFSRAELKTPYASILFGDTAQQTLLQVRQACAQGFSAVKVGWGPIGALGAREDADHFYAAREALGNDGLLFVDAGQVWGENVDAAAERLPALEGAGVTWLEEPFHANALAAYAALAKRCTKIKLAGGEGSHNALMAQNLIDYGHIGYVQIDCGRIGGIGPAQRIAHYAAGKSITYVNHTFTSHLALSASLQPYAGLAKHRICEYPAAPKALAWDLTINHLEKNCDGEIAVPSAPGLGVSLNPEALRKYRVDVEIFVEKRNLFRTPAI